MVSAQDAVVIAVFLLEPRQCLRMRRVQNGVYLLVAGERERLAVEGVLGLVRGAEAARLPFADEDKGGEQA